MEPDILETAAALNVPSSRTRSFPARTPKQRQAHYQAPARTEQEQGPPVGIHLLSHSLTHTRAHTPNPTPNQPAPASQPASQHGSGSTPIQCQSDAGTCRSLMATHPAIAEGISTQNRSPIPPGKGSEPRLRYIPAVYRTHTHVQQHSKQQHSPSTDRPSSTRLDSNQFYSAHDTRPGNGLPGPADPAQGYLFFSPSLLLSGGSRRTLF